ncbi:hypothetical protein, partial [Flavobacterium anhuiense]|uniref:hypothetical protein n=1 Tax=Flavobacterium anhuiense TaxID=459526 RepID=UPI001A919524
PQKIEAHSGKKLLTNIKDEMIKLQLPNFECFGSAQQDKQVFFPYICTPKKQTRQVLENCRVAILYIYMYKIISYLIL